MLEGSLFSLAASVFIPLRRRQPTAKLSTAVTRLHAMHWARPGLTSLEFEQKTGRKRTSDTWRGLGSSVGLWVRPSDLNGCGDVMVNVPNV